MKLEREAIFRVLEPPPGGSARLRERLAGSTERSVAPAWLAGPVAVAVLAALTFFAFDFRETGEAIAPDDELYLAAAFDRLLGRPSQPLPIRVSIGEEEIPVSEVPTSAPGIRLFALDADMATTDRGDDTP